MSDIWSYIWIAGIGLAVGSFLNVLIYRIPRKLQFALGRSFCPACKGKIGFYDNIPLLSYLILGGKCRTCRAKIPIRYPVVEMLNAAGYLFFFHDLGWSYPFFTYSFLTSILIVVFFIDLEFQIIPDILTSPGMAIGLVLSILPGGIGIIDSAVGLIVGGAALYLVALAGDWLFKKESMGGGDIKMAAMLGAFLGWQKVILIFLSGAFLGLIISLIIMLFSKRLRASRTIPFGPFLAVAAIIAIIFGDSIIAFYLNHFLRA
jgi:leader peptidase (prepilin peptidase)/N-methyltransferase